jgi:hypothetical protein
LFRLSIDFVHELTQQQFFLGPDSDNGLEVPEPEEGPVEVTMGFQIEPSKRGQFPNLLREIRDICLRNGVSSFPGIRGSRSKTFVPNRDGGGYMARTSLTARKNGK